MRIRYEIFIVHFSKVCSYQSYSVVFQQPNKGFNCGVFIKLHIEKLFLVVVVEAVPSIEDEAGAILTVFAEFALFEDAEGLADAAGAAIVFGVEDVTKFIGSETK